MPIGFEAKNRVELIRGIAYVQAVTCVGSVWNPEQAVQRHDVVETDGAGVSEVSGEGITQVLIAVFAQAKRIERRKTPILSEREEWIGRRAGGESARKEIALSPDIVALGVDADRQVEVELCAAAIRETAE